MDDKKTPTITTVEQYLKEYGWTFRKITSEENKEAIISPFRLTDKEGVLISLRVEGDFVLVSTVDFMNNIAENEVTKIFMLNDTIKLVKLFPVSENPLNVEVGFELWAESWNKDTFFAFMDMLCLAIETITDKLNKKEISYSPRYASFQ